MAEGVKCRFFDSSLHCLSRQFRAPRFRSFAQHDRVFTSRRNCGSTGFFIDAGQGGFHGVADQVNKQLLDLILVGKEVEVGSAEDANVEADLERDDAIQQGQKGHALEDGGRELRELAIGLDESVEGLRPVFDDAEPALEIAIQDSVGRRSDIGRGDRRAWRDWQDAGAQAAGDGFDRSERIRDFVTDDADEATPGEALFFAQCGADVGEHDKGMGDAALTESTAADDPALRLAGLWSGARLRPWRAAIQAERRLRWARRGGWRARARLRFCRDRAPVRGKKHARRRDSAGGGGFPDRRLGQAHPFRR